MSLHFSVYSFSFLLQYFDCRIPAFLIEKVCHTILISLMKSFHYFSVYYFAKSVPLHSFVDYQLSRFHMFFPHLVVRITLHCALHKIFYCFLSYCNFSNCLRNSTSILIGKNRGQICSCKKSPNLSLRF